MKTPNSKISTIPRLENNITEERETGLIQSSFDREYEIFLCIKNGDVNNLKKKTEEYLSKGFTMGNMSENSLRQVRYWGVSTIAVAVHYAILGGLDETDAFNMSDECIRYIDTLNTIEEITAYLFDKATDLTYLVYKSRFNASASPAVRRCIHYIHVHLHEKITVDSLAMECGLSRSYLSSLFKKETGVSLHNYITREKLKAANQMLGSGKSISEIAYRLSFCSETHFIECYKKQFGITPGKAEK